MAVTYRTLESITRNQIVPEVVDQLAAQSPLLERILKRKTKMTGMKVEQPVQYAYNPDAGAWGGGFGVLPLSSPEVFTKAIHEWTYYQVPIAWAETDLEKNSGAEAIVDYASNLVKNAVASLRDTFGKDLYKDGTVNSLGFNTIDGLSAICTHNANPTPGAYGDIDRTSVTGTRSSYTGNLWWCGQTVAVNAGSVSRWAGTFNFSNASTVIDMRKMNQFLLLFLKPPSALYTSRALFGRLWDLNQANEKVERGEGGNSDTYESGAMRIVINGVPVYSDLLIDNENKIYGVNHDTLYLRYAKFFEQSELKKPTRQRVVGCHVFFDGQLTCDTPNLNGVMTGATAQ